MDWLAKFGPQIIGTLLLIGGVAFFFGRFFLTRIYKSIDLLFLKADIQDGRIRKLEVLAASKADSDTIVAKLLGNGH